MALPIFSIIAFILSFFLAKKNGMSNGQAALVAGAAGLATYTAIDPANPDAIWKPFHSEGGTPNLDGNDSNVAPPSTGIGGGLVDLGGKVVDKIAESPGGLVGGVVGISMIDRIRDFLKGVPPIVWYGVGGVLLYKFAKD